MPNRRGFTLVEMLFVVVMLGIMGVVVTRILIGSFRVSRAQLAQADMQSNVRTAGLAVPLELREIGYDSNTTSNVVTSDIEAMALTEIQFRAMRGIGTTCGTPALTELRIRKPPMAMRNPLLTDGYLLFVENDPNLVIDDQWIPVVVTAIDPDGLCGADSAIVLTVTTPDVAPGTPLALSEIFVGGPIRYYERMRFGLFTDADGRDYVGARSVSLGELAYRAVAGPVEQAWPPGFRFVYFNRAGVLLDPGVAAPAEVRMIELTLQGETARTVNLAGTMPNANRSMTVTTRVALRNTLRH
jgi:prepilin-type N-terminal cleavage/methylation domain-containing protein